MLRLRLGVAVEALTRFAAFRRVVGVNQRAERGSWYED